MPPIRRTPRRSIPTDFYSPLAEFRRISRRTQTADIIDLTLSSLSTDVIDLTSDAVDENSSDDDVPSAPNCLLYYHENSSDDDVPSAPKCLLCEERPASSCSKIAFFHCSCPQGYACRVCTGKHVEVKRERGLACRCPFCRGEMDMTVT